MTRTTRSRMVWRVGHAPVFARRRGFGHLHRGFGVAPLPSADPNSVYNTDCGDGMVLDPGPPAHCILTQYASRLAPIVLSYSQAPNCNVGDLARNLCYYDNGMEGGCNSMPECDPLTGAKHVEYGLPGGPTNVGLPIAVGVPPTGGPTFAPNKNLTNPAGGTVIPMPSETAAQVQQNTIASLGKDLANKFFAALGVPVAGSSASQNAPASGSSGSSSSQQTGGSSQQSGGSSQSGSMSDLVSAPVNLFGFSIPAWGIATALLVGVFAFSGRSR